MDAINLFDDKLLIQIFKHINYYELIKNCMIVNKKWKNTIDQMSFHELSLLNPVSFFVNNWFHRYKLIDPTNVIILTKPNILNSLSFLNRFKDIELLKIDFPIEGNDLDLNCLNFFTKLIHLELSHIHHLSKPVEFDLPNLKCLAISINHLVNQHQNITVKGDKLKILKCTNLGPYLHVNESSIEYLEVFSLNDKINQFKNLKILDVSKLTGLNKIIFSKLPNLIELRCYASNLFELEDTQSINTKFRNDGFKTFIGLKKGREIINQVVNFKLKNSPKNLKIFLKGVLIDTKFRKKSFAIFNLLDMCLHAANLRRLDHNLHWINEINYSIFNKCFAKHQIESISKLYFNVQTINCVDPVEKPILFSSFLKKFPNLSALTFNKPGLRSKFYEMLPKITTSIVQFILFESDEIKINYDFILKFDLLVNFFTTHHLEESFVCEALKKLKLISSFRFVNKNYVVLIEQDKNGVYSGEKLKIQPDAPNVQTIDENANSLFRQVSRESAESAESDMINGQKSEDEQSEISLVNEEQAIELSANKESCDIVFRLISKLNSK